MIASGKLRDIIASAKLRIVSYNCIACKKKRNVKVFQWKTYCGLLEMDLGDLE